MIDWQKYRSLFPHTGNQIYLNHAAIAPMNLRAKAAIQDFCKKRLDTHIEFWPEALERKAQFTELISRMVNVPQENIALVPNTSAGLNILANGLTWKKGDRILLNDFEFPSNVIPFVNLQRFGVEIDYVKHQEGTISIDNIAKKISPRTRLLSISFVEFLNGFRNDLKALGKICREHNLIFSVDSIQGLGALQLDAQACNIDFLSNGGHKWLMWPAGLGFAYISPRIFDDIHPAQAGWLSMETPFDFFNYQQPFAATAQRFEPGVFSTISIMAATATLEMMFEIGLKNIESKILSNTQYMLSKVKDMGLHLYTDPTPEHLSGIVTFYHDQAEELFEYLKEQKVTVSLREGKIRVSPHFYHEPSDLERFFELMERFNE
jgi:selenocysteine lyase/cysteine desulfurase